MCVILRKEKSLRFLKGFKCLIISGAVSEIWTHDLFLTKEVLYPWAITAFTFTFVQATLIWKRYKGSGFTVEYKFFVVFFLDFDQFLSII